MKSITQDMKFSCSIRNTRIEVLQGYVISVDVEFEKYSPSGDRMRFRTTYNTATTHTPVWEPELRQNTPSLGLHAGEEYWPILGDWVYDYNENGNLKPVEEIRPGCEHCFRLQLRMGRRQSGSRRDLRCPRSSRRRSVCLRVPLRGYEWQHDWRPRDADRCGKVMKLKTQRIGYR